IDHKHVAAISSPRVAEDAQHLVQFLLAGHVVEKQTGIHPMCCRLDGFDSRSVRADDLFAHALERLLRLHFKAGETDATALLDPIYDAVIEDLSFPRARIARPNRHFAWAEKKLVSQRRIRRPKTDMRAVFRPKQCFELIVVLTGRANAGKLE